MQFNPPASTYAEIEERQRGHFEGPDSEESVATTRRIDSGETPFTLGTTAPMTPSIQTQQATANTPFSRPAQVSVAQPPTDDRREELEAKKRKEEEERKEEEKQKEKEKEEDKRRKEEKRKEKERYEVRRQRDRDVRKKREDYSSSSSDSSSSSSYSSWSSSSDRRHRRGRNEDELVRDQLKLMTSEHQIFKRLYHHCRLPLLHITFFFHSALPSFYYYPHYYY